MRDCLRCYALLAAVFAAHVMLPALPAVAETPPGTEADRPAHGLSGQVTDPDGAIVPGAAVRLTGAGGWSREIIADSAGRYAFTNLP